MKFWIAFLAFFTFWSTADGQRLLFHYSRNREAIYFRGDVISFRVKGDNTKYTARIQDFQDSLLIFQNYAVNLAEITYLYADSKTKLWFIMRYKYQQLFTKIGIIILITDVINSGKLRKETLTLSGALVGTGLLAKVLIPNKFKIKGKRRLFILK